LATKRKCSLGAEDGEYTLKSPTDLGYCRYLLEHGLLPDGRPDPDKKELQDGGSCETFFTETGNGKYVPRSIFVDLDPSVCDPTAIEMLGSY
jgi:hypothetical protein